MIIVILYSFSQFEKNKLGKHYCCTTAITMQYVKTTNTDRKIIIEL